jgi:hypothetical protein
MYRLFSKIVYYKKNLYRCNIGAGTGAGGSWQVERSGLINGVGPVMTTNTADTSTSVVYYNSNGYTT